MVYLRKEEMSSFFCPILHFPHVTAVSVSVNHTFLNKFVGIWLAVPVP